MKLVFSKQADLPTKFGKFKIIAFKYEGSTHEHCLLFKGELKGSEDVLIRIHSECLTGDGFSSLKCDCGDQLHHSLQQINQRGNGVIVYLRQEGRGIGLFNKVNAYSLQDQGQNTVQANESLGFGADLRTYEMVQPALEYVGIKSVILMSNNPKKMEIFKGSTVKLSSVMPIVMQENPHNKDYLKVKKEQMDHRL